MSYEHILYQVEGAVATLTLNRPERLNAITPLMREEIYQAIAESEESNDVRAVIITGAGKGFCSGGDVKAMQENIKNRQGNPLEERITPMRDKVVLAMRETSKPLIAAINGAAAGGGLGLALSCDIRLASNNARMGMTFSRRGLHPDWGGTYFLPRLVGTAKAAELIWSGRMIEADEALHLGIVSYVTEPDALMEQAQNMAQQFADSAPVAIRLTKRSIYANMDSDLREALERESSAQAIAASTRDYREGVDAFVEKRKPRFTGE